MKWLRPPQRKAEPPAVYPPIAVPDNLGAVLDAAIARAEGVT
jgi:hypothetical protein